MSSNTGFVCFWKEKPGLISLILNTKSEKHDCVSFCKLKKHNYQFETLCHYLLHIKGVVGSFGGADFFIGKKFQKLTNKKGII